MPRRWRFRPRRPRPRSTRGAWRRSGRAGSSTRFSLQPSSSGPPKSSAERSWAWTQVPNAPSRMRTRSSSAARKSVIRRDRLLGSRTRLPGDTGRATERLRPCVASAPGNGPDGSGRRGGRRRWWRGGSSAHPVCRVAPAPSVRGCSSPGSRATASSRSPAACSAPTARGLSALWALGFLLGPGACLPVEQEVSRAIASRRARGLGGGPVVRRATIATGVLAAVLVVGTLAVGRVLVADLFDDDVLLLVGLVLLLVGYAFEYLVRGVLAGNDRFGPTAGCSARRRAAGSSRRRSSHCWVSRPRARTGSCSASRRSSGSCRSAAPDRSRAARPAGTVARAVPCARLAARGVVARAGAHQPRPGAREAARAGERRADHQRVPRQPRASRASPSSCSRRCRPRSCPSSRVTPAAARPPGSRRIPGASRSRSGSSAWSRPSGPRCWGRRWSASRSARTSRWGAATSPCSRRRRASTCWP